MQIRSVSANYIKKICRFGSGFEGLSKEWSEENGVFKALHSMNLLRVPWITQKMSNEMFQFDKPLSGFKILDVGCGGGILSLPLCRLGATVTGIDECSSAIEQAEASKEKLALEIPQNECPEFVSMSLEQFATVNNDRIDYYDAVVMSEVLEHVYDVPFSLKCANRVLKPTGHLFVTTINRTIQSLILAKFVAEYVLRLLPPGIHEWDKFIKPDHLEKVLVSQNFQPLTLSGMTYHPRCNQWSWSQSISINYALHAVKSSAISDSKCCGGGKCSK